MRINLDLSRDKLEKYSKIFTSIIHGNNYELLHEIKEDELEEVSGYIKSNKFNLTSLSASAIAVVKRSNLKQIFYQQLNRQKRIINSFSEIKRQFDAQGISFVFIKSPGYFPLFSDNLDIIIHPHSAKEAKRVLEENNYFELFKWSEAFKAYYRKYKGTSEVLSVHLHEKVAWDGKIFLDFEKCYNDKQEMKNFSGYYMPGPENAFIITLAHAIFENKYILLGDYQNLIYLIHNFSLDLHKITKLVGQYSWSQGFDFSVKTIIEFENCLKISNGLNSLFEITKQKIEVGNYLPITINKLESRVMFIKSMVKDNSVSIPKRIGWIFGMVALALKRKFKITIQSYFQFRQTSFIISFSGQDNSGKTTIINSINKVFNECDFSYVNIWSRIGSSSLFLKLLTRPFNFLKGESNLSEIKDSDRRSRRFSYLKKNKLQMFLWLIFSLIDYSVRMNSVILYYKIRGKVIFLDRYYFDVLEELENISTNSFLKKIVFKIIFFKPDVSFYLIDDSLEKSKKSLNIDVSSNIVYKTKGINSNTDYCIGIITKAYFHKRKIKHLFAGELN